MVPEVGAPFPELMRGATLLDGPPDARDEALLEERLQQNMPNTRRRSLCRDMVVGVAGNENNWRGNVAVAQTAGQIDAVHIRHLVVDHKTIDAARTDGVQQRRAVPERAN